MATNVPIIPVRSRRYMAKKPRTFFCTPHAEMHATRPRMPVRSTSSTEMPSTSIA